MALPSIPAALDADYLAAVIAALSAICWQHECTGRPNSQTVHEYRGADSSAPTYRVTDLDTDPGTDWWPVAVVTTTGSVIAPTRAATTDPETADMFGGFAAALARAEAVTG